MKPGDKRKNGRPRAELDITLVQEMLSQDVRKAEIARRLGVSRPTLDARLAEHLKGGKVEKAWDGEVRAGPMEPGEFRRIKKHLGLTTAQINDLLGLGTRTAERWSCASMGYVPAPEALCLRLLAKYPHEARRLLALAA